MDSGWLSRCQVFDEVEEPQKPVVGNLELMENQEQLCIRSEPTSKESKTALKSSVAESHLDPVETSVGINVTLDAKPGSLGPDGERVNHRTSELTTDHNTDSEEPESVPVTARAKPKRSQESDERPQVENSESRGGKKKGQKRHREDEDEVDESEEKKGGVKKRRRTKKGEAAGEDVPKKGGRKKGKEDEDMEDPVSEKKTKKTAIPQENLLGEVDEEETRAAYRMKNTVSIR